MWNMQLLRSSSSVYPFSREFPLPRHRVQNCRSNADCGPKVDIEGVS